MRFWGAFAGPAGDGRFLLGSLVAISGNRFCSLVHEAQLLPGGNVPLGVRRWRLGNFVGFGRHQLSRPTQRAGTGNGESLLAWSMLLRSNADFPRWHGLMSGRRYFQVGMPAIGVGLIGWRWLAHCHLSNITPLCVEISGRAAYNAVFVVVVAISTIEGHDWSLLAVCGATCLYRNCAGAAGQNA
jgi:hypothetical protein